MLIIYPNTKSKSCQGIIKRGGDTTLEDKVIQIPEIEADRQLESAEEEIIRIHSMVI